MVGIQSYILGGMAEIFNPKTPMGLERILKEYFWKRDYTESEWTSGRTRRGRITQRQIVVKRRVLFSCLL